MQRFTDIFTATLISNIKRYLPRPTRKGSNSKRKRISFHFIHIC